MPSTKRAKTEKPPKAQTRTKAACNLNTSAKPERRKFEKKKDLLTIDVSLSAPDTRAVDAHRQAKTFALYTSKMLDAKDKKAIPCNPEAGKKALAKGKLELAFFSEAQRKRYNADNPDAPKLDRAGPIIRLCEGQRKPRLLPVEGFEDAYEKSNAFRKCVLKDGKPESTCIKEIAGSLALGRIPKRRKARR
jgi:hypothetical protein